MKEIKRLFTGLFCLLAVLALSSCIIVEVPGNNDKKNIIDEAREKIQLKWENKTGNLDDAYSIFEWTQPECLDRKVRRYFISKNSGSKKYDLDDFGSQDFWKVPSIYRSSDYDDKFSIKPSARKVLMDYIIHYDEPAYLWIELNSGTFYNLGKFELN